MSRVCETKPTTNDRLTPRLDDFFTAVRDTNPFASNRVTEPSPYDVDVQEIHGAGFDRLVVLSSQAMSQRSAIGVALLGGAGVGKSHLLSRLYRWANGKSEADNPRACYVYLHNVLADPERLPRYLLKYVLSRLSEGGQGPLFKTPLYRFVDRGIRHALEGAGVKADHLENMLKEAVTAYRAYFGKTCQWTLPYEILFQFWRFARPEKASEPGRRTFALTALNWLAGDEIDPGLASKLGFKCDGQEPVMLRDDEEVKEVFAALAQLALVSGQPLIVCIDQVENLDPDKVKPLARFLHTLLDHASNLLVITSGVKQTLLGYYEDEIIPQAAWDRIAQYRVDLKRIVRADARKILEARLERFLDPFSEAQEVRRRFHEDTLFPLSREWLERQLGDGIDFRPRDVLSWARDAWEQQQAEISRVGPEAWLRAWPRTSPDRTGPIAPPVLTAEELERAIDEVVERKIAEHVEQLRLHPGSLPPDAGNLAGLVESLLAHCQGDGLPYTFRAVERKTKKAGKLPPYDLHVQERRQPDDRVVATGILCVTNVGNSATAALRRLLEDNHPPDHRLLITDHERRPLKVGIQGLEYLRDLQKLGEDRFEHLKIDFEQYAKLDALRNVVGMARSGDLEIEVQPGSPRAVTEEEVVASHHRKDRYRSHPVLRPLLTEEPPIIEPPPEEVQLDENDVRKYVMAQLAWMMGSTASAIAKGYIGVMKTVKISEVDAWPQVKTIVEQMHTEELIYATPQDDDLFLLLRK
jgi:hypothetical protein